MKRQRDPNDPWLWAEPLTPERLRFERPSDKPAGHYTCDGCELAARCTLVFDDYNTDGDCLLSK